MVDTVSGDDIGDERFKNLNKFLYIKLNIHKKGHVLSHWDAQSLVGQTVM